jgi:hypothetical protein
MAAAATAGINVRLFVFVAHRLSFSCHGNGRDSTNTTTLRPPGNLGPLICGTARGVADAEPRR